MTVDTPVTCFIDGNSYTYTGICWLFFTVKLFAICGHMIMWIYNKLYIRFSLVWIVFIDVCLEVCWRWM